MRCDRGVDVRVVEEMRELSSPSDSLSDSFCSSGRRDVLMVWRRTSWSGVREGGVCSSGFPKSCSWSWSGSISWDERLQQQKMVEHNWGRSRAISTKNGDN